MTQQRLAAVIKMQMLVSRQFRKYEVELNYDECKLIVNLAVEMGRAQHLANMNLGRLLGARPKFAVDLTEPKPYSLDESIPRDLTIEEAIRDPRHTEDHEVCILLILLMDSPPSAELSKIAVRGAEAYILRRRRLQTTIKA